MIYTDSRYATGTLVTPYDLKRDNYYTSVLRNFPDMSTSYYNYVWKEGDRMDLVASQLLGNPHFDWKIMDFNPEIMNQFDIPVGTLVRIPRV